MKRWKMIVLASGLFLSVSAGTPAVAINVWQQCDPNSSTKVCKASGEENEKNAAFTVKKIINLLLFAIGIVSVIMVIWGGMKYVTSRGDAANVKAAKDTITYAVVGLIVALLAYVIVNFIIAAFK